jgi:ribosomal protein S12 methylthiotransferase
MRGRLASRPAGEVLREAEALVRSGVRELLVISQDTSAYGSDLAYREDSWRGRTLPSRITELAAALGELGAWVRLHYVYPYPHVDELLPLMADDLVLPYLDIPLQHGSPRILKLMRRPGATDRTLERIHRWREQCPDLALRSTFIVGFPGETDAEFEALLDFLDEAQLDRVGCFIYSPVSGAAANELPDPVPETVQKAREAEFMARQAAISTARLQAKVGSRQEVLIDRMERRSDDLAAVALGRTRGDAPEIDGLVYVEDPGDAQPGDLLQVRIEGSDEHDLWGRPALD